MGVKILIRCWLGCYFAGYKSLIGCFVVYIACEWVACWVQVGSVVGVGYYELLFDCIMG